MDKICPVFGSGWEIHGLNKSPRELVQDVVAYAGNLAEQAGLCALWPGQK